MKKWITICLTVTLLLSAGALANLTYTGNPVPTNSWAQGFNETGVGPFDLVAVQMVSGGPLESPGFSSLPAGWSTVFTPALTISTTGSPINNMTWSINFIGPQSDPLAFNFVAFLGDTRLESAHAVWNGGGWTITADTWKPTRAELVVPVPGAILLGGIGVSLVGWLRRRRTL